MYGIELENNADSAAANLRTDKVKLKGQRGSEEYQKDNADLSEGKLIRHIFENFRCFSLRCVKF